MPGGHLELCLKDVAAPALGGPGGPCSNNGIPDLNEWLRFTLLALLTRAFPVFRSAWHQNIQNVKK